MTAAAIATQGLTRRFDQLTAVDGLTLTVATGEIFGMLGHNGAGKTTTVRLLNGVLAADGGTTAVLGMDPAVEGPAVRRRTGVLTETPSLDDRLSGRANLAIYAQIYGLPPAEIPARTAALLDRFGLDERADDKVAGYSTGMRQRLALARTLIHDPELIFLDEPTAGLDPAATREVHELILALSRERQRTVFLCTHNLIEAQRLCARVAVMAHGRMLAAGSPRELGQRYAQRQRVMLRVAPEQVAQAKEEIGAWSTISVTADPSAPGRMTLHGLAEARIPDLVRALTAAGINLYAVGGEEPTLEDVYFALQGEGAP